MLITGIGVTEEERLADLRMYQTRHCEKTKEYLMNYSRSFVHVLLKVSAFDLLIRPRRRVYAEASQGERL